MESSQLHYLEWRGDLSFKASPFNLVDAAILAHLAYEHIEGLVSSTFKEQITIHQLAEDFKSSHNHSERIQMGFGINPKTPEILYAAGRQVETKELMAALELSEDEIKSNIEKIAARHQEKIVYNLKYLIYLLLLENVWP